MKLICISDTHSLHRKLPELPEGDVLIHAGDGLGAGTLDDVEEFNDWLSSLPYRHRVVIAGNHDWAFQEAPQAARAALTNAIYLEDEAVKIDGVTFWGSPWTPNFMDWAFMLKRGQPLAEKWQQIPADTDVLITHGPPMGFGDQVDTGLSYEPVGCADLTDRLRELNVKAHVFGHIHEGYGQYQLGNTRLINASTCNVLYQPINPAIVVEL
ncbi:metallophosphatase domain-containing protein [Marinobacter oulmenensis]|uniref:Icc-related predicted phosphoesterase n=1 Tax=Marinobacter oulmenensis TaxID=643747 RepID=A0A840U9R7_9GAMM|nr:metallophosphatase domain-containing protein [Marinobacter oulmenensis]MBB5320953.1 Icc-related predicted phosphoesterase [Marinobacter oulmenensis]